MTKVELNQSLAPEKLEQILLAAAGDVGWTAKSKDHYSEKYTLASVHREKEYNRTEVDLRGKILPAVNIYFHGNRKGVDTFDMYYLGPPFHFATRNQIERYLLAVSERIKAEQQTSES